MPDYVCLGESPQRNEKNFAQEDADEEELFLRLPYLPKDLKSKSWAKKHWSSIVIHLILLSFNLIVVTVFGTSWFADRCLPDPVDRSNPIFDSINYEYRRFELLAIYTHDGDTNPHKPNAFNGPPRPELEDEWDKLMGSSEVRVQQDELGEFSGQDSIIKLTDGSGYYVTISAFHGLHCIRRLHQYMYSEHYYPDYDDHNKFFLRRHTEHCLDWLRQYVQCHADPTLIPIRWTTNDAQPVSKDTGNRQCVAWEPFQEWMAKHSFDPFEPGLLRHPNFGDAYAYNRTNPNLGIHELGHGGLYHVDGKHGQRGSYE